MEMGFAVPAAASFPGSVEREGRRRQGCAGGWEPARRKNSWHRTPPESKGGSTERTVPTPTSICLIHVHVLASHGPFGAAQAFTRNANGVEGDP